MFLTGRKGRLTDHAKKPAAAPARAPSQILLFISPADNDGLRLPNGAALGAFPAYCEVRVWNLPMPVGRERRTRA